MRCGYDVNALQILIQGGQDKYFFKKKGGKAISVCILKGLL